MELGDEGMSDALIPKMLTDVDTYIEDDMSEAFMPNELQLPRFSHTPPASIKGRHRWPASLEAQAFPLHAKPTLNDVLI